jgi:hypothetical protein
LLSFGVGYLLSEVLDLHPYLRSYGDLIAGVFGASSTGAKLAPESMRVVNSGEWCKTQLLDFMAELAEYTSVAESWSKTVNGPWTDFCDSQSHGQ